MVRNAGPAMVGAVVLNMELAAGCGEAEPSSIFDGSCHLIYRVAESAKVLGELANRLHRSRNPRWCKVAN